jgi:hypothetical protein
MVTATENGDDREDGAIQRLDAEERSPGQVAQLQQALVNCFERTRILLSELEQPDFPTGKFTVFLRDQLTASQFLLESFLKQVGQPEGATHSLQHISEYVEIQENNNASNGGDISYLRALHNDKKTIQQDVERLEQLLGAQEKIRAALPAESIQPNLENQIEERSRQLTLLDDGFRGLQQEIETLPLAEQREQGRRILGKLRINVQMEEALVGQIQMALEKQWTVWRDLHEQISEIKALQKRLAPLPPSQTIELSQELTFELKVLEAYGRALARTPPSRIMEEIQGDLDDLKMRNFRQAVSDLESPEKQHATSLRSDLFDELKLAEGEYCVETLNDRPTFVGERVGVIGDTTYYAVQVPPFTKDPHPIIGVPTSALSESDKRQTTLGVAYNVNTGQFKFTPIHAKRPDGIGIENVKGKKTRRGGPKL